jgi:hypothetical protein
MIGKSGAHPEEWDGKPVRTTKLLFRFGERGIQYEIRPVR